MASCVSPLYCAISRGARIAGPEKITVSGLAEIQLAAIGAAHWEEVQQKG
jgi:hypothetical protein